MTNEKWKRPALSVGVSVMARAAELSSLSLPEMFSDTRVRRIARVRFAAIWALREWGMSWKRIAKAVGYQDHTSAIHGYREAQRLRVSEPGFRELGDALLVHANETGTIREAEAA